MLFRSAKEESRWRRILEYFSSAAQIGMTATPKETKYVSNISYFGIRCRAALALYQVQAELDGLVADERRDGEDENE